MLTVGRDVLRVTARYARVLKLPTKADDALQTLFVIIVCENYHFETSRAFAEQNRFEFKSKLYRISWIRNFM